MITIRKQEAIELLERAVQERGPDYIDPGSGLPRGCRYVIDDKPGCIVGLVLHYLGVSTDSLKELDKKGSLLIVTQIDLTAFNLEVSPEAHALLKSAQSQQDSGHPWGVAVDRAIKEAQ